MSSSGTTTCRSSCFATPASTSSIGRPPRDEAADLLERPLRRREADALERAGRTSRSSRSSESARCAPRFVPATACTSSRITRVDRAQQLARLRGQHQEERLRRRDQDVRRRAQHRLRAPSAACRRCAPRRGAATGARRAARAGSARRRSSGPSAARRRARAGLRRASASAVDGVEEGRERLARPGRRLDQRVGAGRDHRPALLLRRRRCRRMSRSNQPLVASEKTFSGSTLSAYPREIGLLPIELYQAEWCPHLASRPAAPDRARAELARPSGRSRQGRPRGDGARGRHARDPDARHRRRRHPHRNGDDSPLPRQDATTGGPMPTATGRDARAEAPYFEENRTA